MLIDAPEPNVRLVIVTGDTGASTGFALGEEVVADLLGVPLPASRLQELAR